jgi:hypothetical protein
MLRKATLPRTLGADTSIMNIRATGIERDGGCLLMPKYSKSVCT